MSKLNKQDVAEHFAAERIVPTNEAEVPPQLIWIDWPRKQADDAWYWTNGEYANTPYVPASALAEVWEKAIAIAKTYTGLKLYAALEAARDAALSAGKGATSEGEISQ